MTDDYGVVVCSEIPRRLGRFINNAVPFFTRHREKLYIEHTFYYIMILDPWQEDVLKTKGHICLRSGRQVGKSTVIAEKAAEFAINNPKKSIMVIASVERQAQLLFEKILSNIHIKSKKSIKTGKDRPTKHKLS